jgi:hypothetical protein
LLNSELNSLILSNDVKHEYHQKFYLKHPCIIVLSSSNKIIKSLESFKHVFLGQILALDAKDVCIAFLDVYNCS